MTEERKSVNYNKLLDEFGTSPITPELLVRLERLAGLPLPAILRRGLFFSHRSLNELLDHVEQHRASNKQGPPFYLYTGRGPSSESLHLGHLIPFIVTKYLSDAFNVPVVIQMTDDEKYLFRDLSQEQVAQMTINNVKDIIAVGFKPERTFIFANTEYIGDMYRNILSIQKALPLNQVRAAFGLNPTDNVGKYAFPPVQIAPAFSSSFPRVLKDDKLPCFIPCAIDQDPFFRLTRDVAGKTSPNIMKPAVIHSKYFPSLLGPGTKMSSSEPRSAIFLDDSEATLKSKINKIFTGGRDTLEEHRRLGADLTVDVPFAYLRVFLEENSKLSSIEKEYGSGRMLTRDIKSILYDTLFPILQEHQKTKALITNDIIRLFMDVHPINESVHPILFET